MEEREKKEKTNSVAAVLVEDTMTKDKPSFLPLVPLEFEEVTNLLDVDLDHTLFVLLRFCESLLLRPPLL